METMVQEKPNKLFNTLKIVANSFIKKEVAETLTEEEMLREQLDVALEELDVAQSNFDNAELDYLDIANEELTIAHNKLNVIIKKIKKIGNS